MKGFVKFSDEMKGVSINFAEIDGFLQDHPDWRSRVVFTIIGVTPPHKTSIYEASRREIFGWRDQINDKYRNSVTCSDAPGNTHDGHSGDGLQEEGLEHIYYEERTTEEMQLHHRLAYFAAADVLMVTVIP